MATLENAGAASSAPLVPGSARHPAHDSDPVLVVMGVSGSGKSTVAALVAERLGWDLAEGDAHVNAR